LTTPLAIPFRATPARLGFELLHAPGSLWAGREPFFAADAAISPFGRRAD
jgi:hypothetical protein